MYPQVNQWFRFLTTQMAYFTEEDTLLQMPPHWSVPYDKLFWKNSTDKPETIEIGPDAQFRVELSREAMAGWLIYATSPSFQGTLHLLLPIGGKKPNERQIAIETIVMVET